MSDTRVIRLALSDAGATAALGVNLLDAEVVLKTEIGPNQMDAGHGGSYGLSCYSLCHDWSGNLYVADGIRHVILKVTFGGGSNGNYQVTTVAGLSGTSGHNSALQNVAGTDARFNTPWGIACDRSGNLYIADSGNNQIRKISADGKVSVFAGAGSIGYTTPGTGSTPASGFLDGNCLDARFSAPYDVAVDRSGVVYVADKTNHAVRKIVGGKVVTIAGNGSSGDLENLVPGVLTTTWPSRLAVFNTPSSISVDNNGNVYVADVGNKKVKKITPNGAVYLFSGSGDDTDGTDIGTSTNVSSNAFTSNYHAIYDLDTDRSGNVYLLDKDPTYGSRVMKLSSDGNPSVVAQFHEATTYNASVYSLTVSPSQEIFVGTYIA